MSKLNNNQLILSREESINLLSSLRYPNNDNIRKRDEFISDVNSWDVSKINNVTVIDIPDFDIPELNSPSISLEFPSSVEIKLEMIPVCKSFITENILSFSHENIFEERKDFEYKERRDAFENETSLLDDESLPQFVSAA